MKRVAHITQQLVRDLRDAAKCEELAAHKIVACLIVEDEEADGYLALEAVGSVGGVSAMLARNGEDAMRLLKEADEGFRPHFDIVFVDLKLTGSHVQGEDIIQMVRQQYPTIHIVIISGHLGQEVIEALRGAYVGIVAKPLQAENLEEIIAKHRMRRHED